MGSFIPAAARALAVPELVLEVASHLGPADLASTAQLNRAWQGTSELVLYRRPDVRLDYSPSAEGTNRLRLLAETLYRRADLAARVRELELVFAWDLRSVDNDLTRPQVAAHLLGLCTELEEIKLWLDESVVSQGVVALIALHAWQLKRLACPNLPDPAFLAPYLPAFTQLTHLDLNACIFTEEHISNWPNPTFQLVSLRLPWQTDRDKPRPSLAEFRWFTVTSRESLRHLELGGGERGIVADVLEWGGGLRRVVVHVVYDSRESELEVSYGGDADEGLELVKLKGLERLKIAVQMYKIDMEHPGRDEVVGAIEEAVARANRGVGRDVAAVEWIEEDAM